MNVDDAAFDLGEAFQRERAYLFGVAYRMLGRASEAEDVLQEAWLRVRDLREAPRSTRAMLTTVVVRLCLDVAKSARARREAYVGPWLPEPLLMEDASAELAPVPAQPDERIGMRESLSMAMLVVLETLSPLERAVFLLREVFDYDFTEIAIALGRSEAACRQLFHRARGHVLARRPRFEPDPEEAKRITALFFAAVARGDVEAAASMLSRDCAVTSDGGGRVSAARKQVVGSEHVARFFVGIAKKGLDRVVPSLESVNGQPGLVLRVGGVIVNVTAMCVVDGLVRDIHVVLNPEKLAHLDT